MSKLVRRLAVALLLTAVTRVEAIPVVQLIALDQSAGSAISFMSFDPFDSSLGNLDSVRLQVNGALYGNVLTSPNFEAQDSTTPVPYAYQILMDHRLRGFTFDFGFSNPAKFLVHGIASGMGDAVPINMPFSYSMTFDSLTDLFGFSMVSSSGVIPPVMVNSSREEFVANVFTAAAGLMLSSELIPVAIAPSIVAPLVGLTGFAMLTYNYTEFSDPLDPDLPDDPIAVPEPGMLWLLFAGLLSVFGLRHLQAATKP